MTSKSNESSNLATLSAAIGVDEEDYAELLVLFIDTSGVELKEMKAAFKNGDFTKAAKAAHSIKGAALNLGLMELSALSEAVETVLKEGPASALGALAARLDSELDNLTGLLPS